MLLRTLPVPGEALKVSLAQDCGVHGLCQAKAQQTPGGWPMERSGMVAEPQTVGLGHAASAPRIARPP